MTLRNARYSDKDNTTAMMLYFTSYVVSEYVTCTEITWCYVLSCVVHIAWARTRGLGRRGRVVRMPRVAESKGWKNEYFSYNLIFYAQRVFKLLSQTEINWISDRNLFETSNFCQGRPLWLFAPGVKKPSYATGSHIRILWDLSINSSRPFCHITAHSLHFFLTEVCMNPSPGLYTLHSLPILTVFGLSP